MLRTSLSTRTGVLLLAAALVAGACSSGSDDGSDATSDVRNATVSSTKIPVYDVVSTGLTTTQTAAMQRALAARLPNGAILNRGEFGEVAYVSPTGITGANPASTTAPTNATTSKDDETGGPTTATPAWDTAALSRLTPPTPASAGEIVTAAMKGIALGDTPGKIVTGPIRLEIYDPAKKTMTFDRAIGATGSRSATLSGVPVIGPGHAVDVQLGPDGKVAILNVAVRTLKSGASVSVPTGASAVQRCIDTLEATKTGSSKGLQLQASLVYYAPPLGTGVKTIEPALKCAGSTTDGTLFRPFIVVANLAKPLSFVNFDLLWKAIQDNPASGLELGTSYLQANARAPLGLTGTSTNALEDRFSSVMNLVVNQNDSAPATIFTSADSAAGGADTVDLMWYTGHANGSSWQATSGNVNVADVRLGDADLEWLVVAACGPLQDNAGGLGWQDRLGPMFDGLHLLMGYATVSNDSSTEGPTFASLARGYYPGLEFMGRLIPSISLATAWATTATMVQPADVVFGVMGVQNGTVGTQTDCLTCKMADIPASVAGRTFWRVTGNS